jgi:hypothetical protein
VTAGIRQQPFAALPVLAARTTFVIALILLALILLAYTPK